MQARPQEPPEVYTNLLPPSVGETTGGIHPIPSVFILQRYGLKVKGEKTHRRYTSPAG